MERSFIDLACFTENLNLAVENVLHYLINIKNAHKIELQYVVIKTVTQNQISISDN